MKKKDKLKNQQCYMCGAPATSREHVPPLCLFPEEKDTPFKNLRNNLITVPSCELHNSKKSKDDEILMAVLAGYVGNNFIGFLHTQTKIARAIERNERFMDTFLKDAIPKWVKNERGKLMPIMRGEPDYSRLVNCFEHIAHGLYFHHFQNCFDGKVYCMIDFVKYVNEMAETWKEVYRKSIDLEEHLYKIEGSSPEVFKYFMTKPDKDGVFAMRLTFYEGAMVFISFHPTNANIPDDLLTQRIKSGVPFTAVLKDGSAYKLSNLENEI